MNAIHEQPVIIQGTLPAPLLGVLTTPHGATPPSGTGVVIVNGGAQYRAGAHRLFVQLARHLAQQGHAVLRFDFPGQGDNHGEPVGFEDTAPHIAAAIDHLHQHQSRLHNTILMGLCDGASGSLLYLEQTRDERISHLILLNPWVHSPVSQARAQVKHYYRQRLLMPDFWRKLIRGGVSWSAAGELWTQWRLSRQQPRASSNNSFQDRMAAAWHTFPGKLLLILSEHDRVAQEFSEHVQTSPAWDGWQRQPGLQPRYMNGADHTFSPEGVQADLLQAIQSFLENP